MDDTLDMQELRLVLVSLCSCRNVPEGRTAHCESENPGCKVCFKGMFLVGLKRLHGFKDPMPGVHSSQIHAFPLWERLVQDVCLSIFQFHIAYQSYTYFHLYLQYKCIYYKIETSTVKSIAAHKGFPCCCQGNSTFT